MWAADHGHSDTCKLLLEAKAKINLQDFVSLTWLLLWRLDLCAKNVNILHNVHSLFVLLTLVRLHSIDSSSKRWSCWDLHCPSGFRGQSSCCVHTRKWGRNCGILSRTCLLNIIQSNLWTMVTLGKWQGDRYIQVDLYIQVTFTSSLW